MPPLLLFVAMGVGGYAAYRMAIRIKAEVEARRRAEEASVARASGATRDLGNLEWDSEAGVYRPRRSTRS